MLEFMIELFFDHVNDLLHGLIVARAAEGIGGMFPFAVIAVGPIFALKIVVVTLATVGA